MRFIHRIRYSVEGMIARHKHILVTGLAYQIITIIILYPLSIRPGTLLPVHAYDTYQHLWSLWWFRHAIVHLGISPAQVTHLYAPEGAYMPLLMTAPIPHLFSIPLQPIFGLIGTYNFLLLISFPLCGMAMYALALDVTRSRPGAFIAGLIYAFFPGKMVHIAGHYLQFHIYWLPLYVLFLLRLIRQPGRKNALLTGLFLALSSISHLMHAAYFVGLITPFILLYYLIFDRRAILNRRFAGGLTTALIVASIIMAPFYGPYIYDTLTHANRFDYPGGDVIFCADLLHLFVPVPVHPIVQRIPWLYRFVTGILRYENSFVESTVYLGWSAMAVAVLGALKYGRRVRLWGTLTLFSALLTLGPLLQIGGKVITLTFDDIDTAVLLPYGLLKILPFYSLGRTPGRINTLVTVAFAVVCACGVAWLYQQLARFRKRWLLVPALAAVILFEYVTWWPLPTFATPVSPFYEQIADSGHSSVFTFPYFFMRDSRLDTAPNWGMLYQTIHGHPINGGYIHRWPHEAKGRTVGLDHLLMPERGIDIFEYADNWHPATILSTLGYRYVVVPKPVTAESSPELQTQSKAWGAKEILSRADRALASERFSSMFNLIYEDDQLWVYRVPDDTIDARALWMYVGMNWEVDPWQTPEGTTRRMADGAEIIIESIESHQVVLSFQISGLENSTLRWELNGDELVTFHVGTDWQELTTRPFELEPGRNVLRIHNLTPPEHDDPRLAQIRNVRLLPVEKLVTQAAAGNSPIDIVAGKRDRTYLGGGFYSLETHSDLSYRWTAGKASILTPWPGADPSEPLALSLRLDLATWRPEGVPAPQIAIEIEGIRVYEGVAADPHRHIIEIDTPPLENRNLLELEIEIMSDPWTPGVMDSRSLGIAFFGLNISTEQDTAR